MSELAVWMNGDLVGTWSAPRRGQHLLKYDAGWVASERGRPLSLSLPITADLTVRGAAVGNYFDNLLPDNAAIRERVRRRHNARSAEAFDLLKEIGRDCVGAVQLMPPHEAPGDSRRIAKGAPLTDGEVEQLLMGITGAAPPGRIDDNADFRISIAGAQEKTALLKVGECWHVPQGATPTTHILKLPLGPVGNLRINVPHSVENEWLCLHLLRLLGLPAANASIEQFGSQKALAVERFDRQLMSDPEWIVRLPQEDFCQASGLAPNRKYETDGGPGIDACLRLLEGSSNRLVDMERFLLSQLAFWLLAATDGHAKNFSIFNGRDGRYAMTPLYDVMSVWPLVGKGADTMPIQRVKLAMGVRATSRHDVLDTILPRHWSALAQESHLPGMSGTMLRMVERVDAALSTAADTLPPGFPMPVFNAIRKGMMRQARKYLQSEGARA